MGSFFNTAFKFGKSVSAKYGGFGFPPSGSPPYKSFLLAHYTGNNGLNLTDEIDPKKIDPSVEVGRVNCLGVTASSEITLAHLAGTESVTSFEGTQGPTVAAGKLTFAGTGY